MLAYNKYLVTVANYKNSSYLRFYFSVQYSVFFVVVVNMTEDFMSRLYHYCALSFLYLIYF